MVNRPVTVSLEGLEVAAELTRVSLPGALAPEPMWFDDNERALRTERARGELSELGLWRGNGLSEEFAETVTVIGRAQRELIAYLDGDGWSARIHVAALGANAVLSRLESGTNRVSLRPARPDLLAEDLIGALPQAAPAQGHSQSVPEPELDDALDCGVPRRDARRIIEMLASPRAGGGRISAGVRDGLGAHRRSRNDTCTYLDTEQGRYLLYFTPNPGGDRYVNLVPARREVMIAKTYDLLKRIGA